MENIYLTWKQSDVCFSSSTIREHSDGSNESPNIIAPSKTSIYKLKEYIIINYVHPYLTEEMILVYGKHVSTTRLSKFNEHK